MEFLCLSDTHGKHRLLRNLPKADVIIHAGDLSKDGSERSCTDFMNWFTKLDYRYKVFIAGNHDFFFESASENYLKKVIPAELVYLNDSGLTIEGINIWGSPVTPRFYDWAFNRDRGKVIDRHWKLVPANTDILITHGPPAGILDEVGLNNHAGCVDLLRHVKRIKPKFHIFGHIHGLLVAIRQQIRSLSMRVSLMITMRLKTYPRPFLFKPLARTGLSFKVCNFSLQINNRLIAIYLWHGYALKGMK